MLFHSSEHVLDHILACEPAGSKNYEVVGISLHFQFPMILVFLFSTCITFIFLLCCANQLFSLLSHL